MRPVSPSLCGVVVCVVRFSLFLVVCGHFDGTILRFRGFSERRGCFLWSLLLCFL
jgi:hypothetical protein